MRAGQDDIQSVATKYGFDVAWLGKEKKARAATKGPRVSRVDVAPKVTKDHRMI